MMKRKEVEEKASIKKGTTFLQDTLSEKESGVRDAILAIASGAKTIARELSFRVGLTETLNPFGERQAELDVFANDTFAHVLLESGSVGAVASEEMEKPMTRDGASRKDKLSVAMDPLDGSSNIPTNNSLGSIFGIWRGEIPQRGRDQVASCFVTYGPTLSLTFTTNGSSVDQFIELRDGPNVGRFVLSYRDMKLPERPDIYGFGGSRSEWIPQVKRFVAKLEDRGMKLRYGGTFIGDYNQILQRGGIFSYPELKGQPDGKFRLMYEAAPVALITRAAGGYSSNGRESILDVEAKTLSQRVPLYTGNKELVQELEREISSSV